MNAQIADAIQAHKVLQFDYKGDGIRRVEPHCYGVNHLGHEVLRAFQTSGPSISGGPIPDWRLFTVQDISRLTVLDIEFTGPRPKFNPNDRNMTRVYVAFKSILDANR